MIQLLQKGNPTAFSPMGGGLVPTQEKKNYSPAPVLPLPPSKKKKEKKVCQQQYKIVSALIDANSNFCPIYPAHDWKPRESKDIFKNH